MNILEAIETGLPIKRASWDTWYTCDKTTKTYKSPGGLVLSCTANHMTANDWQVKEATVTISRRFFLECAEKAMRQWDTEDGNNEAIELIADSIGLGALGL